MNYLDPILKVMEKRDITAYKICKDLNINQSTFTNWKDGKKIPLERAIEILRYLGVSADELYGLTEADQNLFELNGEEEYLIELFRKCSKEGKYMVKEIAEFQAGRPKSSGCGPDEELRA